MHVPVKQSSEESDRQRAADQQFDATFDGTVRRQILLGIVSMPRSVFAGWSARARSCCVFAVSRNVFGADPWSTMLGKLLV
jgi:hypothetical protein